MRTLKVDLGSRSYPIYIGENLLSENELLTTHINGKQVVVISNDTVAPLYLDSLLVALKNLQAHKIILSDGESYKTLATIELIFDQLLEKRCARDITIIALGGGVVGDISGFAAACYQRGVDFIQVPTTLLSQVDSSVGGKTGVNHPLGKNMIGAFYQPQCVLADISTLSTLPSRELSAGLAEVIKYGLIANKPFFGWLESNIDRLLKLDTDALEYAIEQSCSCKAEIVASDEYEKSGRRALLNLGHTFGHAIETGMGYGNWLHGEAVGCGMVMAAQFSAKLGWLTSKDVSKVSNLITAANLPTQPPSELTASKMLELMSIDKKVQDGKLHLVLLKDIGEAVLTSDFNHDLLYSSLTELLNNS
ncbi:MAG: 3-dehydroquinate synthase [Gammaproteobacteria bacterium]|nr:3-dehydroquinate synthase [Gammaproteobacteria bacterium]